MTVLAAFVVMPALIGSHSNKRIGRHKIWPGCAEQDARKGHRDWHAWYKQQKSVPDIKVHVYREPPFNWLHPVSDKNTKTVNQKIYASSTTRTCHLLVLFSFPQP